MATTHKHGEHTDSVPFGAVSGGQAPAEAPKELPPRKPQDDPMKYERVPVEDRVPDANNGPMINEDKATAEARIGHEVQTIPADPNAPPPDPTAPPPPPLRHQRS